MDDIAFKLDTNEVGLLHKIEEVNIRNKINQERTRFRKEVLEVIDEEDKRCFKLLKQHFKSVAFGHPIEVDEVSDWGEIRGLIELNEYDEKCVWCSEFVAQHLLLEALKKRIEEIK